MFLKLMLLIVTRVVLTSICCGSFVISQQKTTKGIVICIPSLNQRLLLSLAQGPQRHFEFGGAKNISEVATYIKFEFFKHKIRTY